MNKFSCLSLRLCKELQIIQPFNKKSQKVGIFCTAVPILCSFPGSKSRFQGAMRGYGDKNQHVAASNSAYTCECLTTHTSQNQHEGGNQEKVGSHPRSRVTPAHAGETEGRHQEDTHQSA